MPRLANHIPSYRHHKPSGRAVVTIASRDCYLGPYGSNESRIQYNKLIAEWLAASRPFKNENLSSFDNLTINEQIAQYPDQWNTQKRDAAAKAIQMQNASVESMQGVQQRMAQLAAASPQSVLG